ncbi:signal peptidase I [Streptococcus fryi]
MVKRDFIRNIVLAVLAILMLIFLRLFVFDTYRVVSENANAFIRENDLVTATKHDLPNYKELVVYKFDNKTHIGRVIGLPGQTITYMDDIFYLDTMVESQDYLEKLRTKHLVASNGETAFTPDFTLETLTEGKYQTIPDDYYLILNDDRQNFNDSRTFGLIPKKQIKGTITFRLLPLEDFGFIDVE